MFIASSTEALEVAYAVQTALERYAEVTVWTQGVMRLSRDSVTNLRVQLEASDFGIFIVPPDDSLTSRGKTFGVPRDNVIFELGMFVGRLGVERSFILAPRDAALRLPSDLAGLNVGEYDADRSDHNWHAAVAPAANAIRSELARAASRPAEPQAKVTQTFRDVRWPDLLSGGGTELRIAVHYFDSWVNANLSALRAFARNPDVRISVVVTDPSVASNFAQLKKLFPESSEAALREKIEKTGRRFVQLFDEAEADPDRLAFYLSPELLTYSAQSIDQTTLVLSIFEMYRQSRIDSPAFIIDLTTAPQILSFWEKEWDGLMRSSRRVNPDDPLG